MGLFGLLKRIFLGAPPPPKDRQQNGHSASSPGVESAAPNDGSARSVVSPASESKPSEKKRRLKFPTPADPKVRLDPLSYESSLIPTPPSREIVESRPYRFAFPGPRTGQFLDLSQDADQRWLDYFNLPLIQTPDDLASWLGIPIGKLAWLTHRTKMQHRPENVREAHYVFKWVEKKSGGYRLIESPKADLAKAQHQILTEILEKVPPHSAAHGFVKGRSILTNARPHLGQRYLLKLDLTNFYTTVRYRRVVAIFRAIGYSREASIWMARLTTSSPPWDLPCPLPQWDQSFYLGRHLPQGACTSPILANLSAFGLDIRLTGLAKAYGLKYTRYADDVTLSGPSTTVPALRQIIPLTETIIRSERFQLNKKKRRVVRNNQRQSVTGVVVNERPNISRREFDRLKAIVHNCVKLGPSTQNREGHEHFREHLRGRIAHVLHLNQSRGEKLLAEFARIDWTR